MQHGIGFFIEEELDKEENFLYYETNRLVNTYEKRIREGAMEKVDAKTRILQVAEQLFAEKGFDAARVDEIAKRAGVNKALIYYYFESKENILEELFKEFMLGMVQTIEMSMEELIEFDAEEKLREFFASYLKFWESKKNILRIMMMESLKESRAENEPLFKVMDFLMKQEEDRIKAILKERGFRMDYDRMEALVSDFFTGLLPLFNFVLYKDEWMAHYGIGEEELLEKFTNVFMITHLSYHKVVMDRLRPKKE
jgi:AcrR family transcriptional regulator